MGRRKRRSRDNRHPRSGLWLDEGDDWDAGDGGAVQDEAVPPIRCPTCGRWVPAGSGLQGTWRCGCRTAFLSEEAAPGSEVPYPMPYPVNSTAFRRLVGPPPSPVPGVFAGVPTTAVLVGVLARETFGVQVHAVRPGAHWRPFFEWPVDIRLRAALDALGFAAKVCGGRWPGQEPCVVSWGGRAGGTPVTVYTRTEAGEGEPGLCVMLRPFALSEDPSLENRILHHGDEALAAAVDRFEDDFLLERKPHNGWEVSEQGACQLPFVVPPAPSIGDLAGWLRLALNAAVEECHRAVREWERGPTGPPPLG